MIVNEQNVRNLFRGLRVQYNEGYQASMGVWEQIAMRTESTGSEEEYDFLSAIPGIRKLVGEIQLKNLVAQGFTIKNDEWESTIKVKRTSIERDKVGLYSNLAKDMGRVARQHPNELVAALITNGFDPVKGKCYTGSPFFADAHIPPGTDPALSTFSNKMTAKLSAEGYRQARAAIKSRKNSEGRALNLGQDLVLTCHPKNEALANQILKADTNLLVKGSSFAGVSNVDKGTARAVLLPELGNVSGGEDMWTLQESGWFIKPFVHQVEKEAETNQITNPEDSYVVLNHHFLFQIYARYAAGYGMPELIIGSDGSTAAL